MSGVTGTGVHVAASCPGITLDEGVAEAEAPLETEVAEPLHAARVRASDAAPIAAEILIAVFILLWLLLVGEKRAPFSKVRLAPFGGIGHCGSSGDNAVLDFAVHARVVVVLDVESWSFGSVHCFPHYE